MKFGYLQTEKPIIWDTKKIFGFVSPETEEGRYITKCNWKTNILQSHLCEKCGILISRIEIEKKEKFFTPALEFETIPIEK